MRHKRTGVLLALVAVLAMSAVVASAASAAAPEFKPGTKQAFTGVSGTVTIEFGSGTQVTCTKDSSTGEITGVSTVGTLVLTLTGCEAVAEPSCKLTSEGAKNQGEIVTNVLDGELGEVKTAEAASGVGLLLKPASGKVWAPLIQGACIEGWKLEGTLAAEVTPVKKLGKTTKLVFAGSGAAGSNLIDKITVKGTKLSPNLKLGGSEVSLVASETLTFKGNEVEIS
jgi:hypothetical protein